MPNNAPDVCRLCLTSEGLMLPIFRNYISKNEATFRFKIKSCTSIEIFADDNLPAKVCYVCVHQIEKFFQFQSMCTNSESVLRSQLASAVIGGVNNSTTGDSLLCDMYVPHNRCEGDNEKAVSCSENYKLEDSALDGKTGIDVLTCSVCNSSLLSSDLLIEHLTEHHQSLEFFICGGCKKSFSDVGRFKTHIEFEHSIKCEYCDSVFKYKENLDDHLKIHSVENWKCKYCLKTFDNVKDLKIHESVHLEQTCKFCLKEFSSKVHCQIHEEDCIKKYYCKFCEEEFFLKKDLINHVNNFHDSDSLKCVNCQKPLTELKQLENSGDQITDKNQSKNSCSPSQNEMISEAVEQTKSFLTCKFCTKKFNLKSSLRRHEKSHSGVKPYQCKYCPRQFKDSSTCIVHMRTHTGEHPFQCQECPKDFKQLANLKMHTYRHHKRNEKASNISNSVTGQVNADFEHLYSGLHNKYAYPASKNH